MVVLNQLKSAVTSFLCLSLYHLLLTVLDEEQFNVIVCGCTSYEAMCG